MLLKLRGMDCLETCPEDKFGACGKYTASISRVETVKTLFNIMPYRISH